MWNVEFWLVLYIYIFPPNVASSNATEQKQADSNSEMVTKESSNNMSDDQPLSKWFEEIHAPASQDGSSKAGNSY